MNFSRFIPSTKDLINALGVITSFGAFLGMGYLVRELGPFFAIIPACAAMAITFGVIWELNGLLHGQRKILVVKEDNKPFRIIPVIKTGLLASWGFKPYQSSCSGVMMDAVWAARCESDALYQQYNDVKKKYLATEKSQIIMPSQRRYYETTLTTLKRKLDTYNKKMPSMVAQITQKAVKTHPELFYAKEVAWMNANKDSIKTMAKSSCNQCLYSLDDDRKKKLGIE